MLAASDGSARVAAGVGVGPTIRVFAIGMVA